MKTKLFLIFWIFLPLLLFAKKTYDPWYTGPLLAVSADNIQEGMYNVQPYLYYRDTNGTYSSSWGQHSVPDTFTFESQLLFQMGFTKWLDLTVTASTFYKEKEKERSFQFGDMRATFGFQIIKQKDLTPIPSIRFALSSSFPTGKYDNLSPNKNGIDASGSGSYEPSLNLFLGKTVFWITNHPISWRVNLSYVYLTKAKVKNFNAYGGGYNTRGKVNPGRIFSGIVSFEFSFTQRWVFAMDNVFIYTTKKTFKGNPGISVDGKAATNSLPHTTQFSLAPAIEYNFNKYLGVLGGFHIFVRGKNSTKFLSGIISVTYTF